ncbi:cell wall-active antibiotics response protein LiaF [Alkalicoccus luteus]|uniref:Cell wall-active antibiotics response protein n=1 Tax=Alkalicoccus luteus TaxID=1237094 RepID=A0A969PRC7_9BACI|nr:cell wall-active antibiotics response protein LiaF [Alkalicoccus luteus]NJP37604.1 cell wall-active antibiotics response protein [Alkalicoccus luteus]
MRKIIGLILLASGVVFLAVNSGWISLGTDRIFLFGAAVTLTLLGLKWTAEGFFAMIRSFKRDRRHIGLLLFGLWTISAAAALGYNQYTPGSYSLQDVWNWTWPVFLFYAGFKLFFDRDTTTVVKWEPGMKPGEKVNKKKKKKMHGSFDGFSGGAEKTALGDMSIGRQPWEPAGRRLQMGAGSVEIDFTKAILHEGDNQMHISCGIGSVEIQVPEGMAISVRGAVKLGEVTIFHDSQAGSGRTVSFVSEGFHEAERRLVLHIAVGLGDLEVIQVG